MSATILSLYRKFESRPFGRQLFSWLVCRKAPYFASIRPRIVSLAPGRGEATIAHRRAVTNHIGTVHAIALCNLAEFVGGLTTDASLPSGMRWIPKGMTVSYLHKATGRMHAVATPDFAPHVSDNGYPLPVSVVVSNDAGEAVFRASIDMWVSPSPKHAS
ncbi:hotdog fold domain-containing protein [Luteimonas sp. RIT-PG2_3]